MSLERRHPVQLLVTLEEAEQALRLLNGKSRSAFTTAELRAAERFTTRLHEAVEGRRAGLARMVDR